MKQIILEIPDDKYDSLVKQMKLDRNFSQCAITPLPEHHGRLADIDKAEKEIRSYIADNKDSDDLFLAGCGDGAYHALITLKCATIIPATKGVNDADSN